ncbi:MAG TPA: M20/M25/M40 family metallo-hydrolase, partial [Rhizomicrobium sp.]
MGSGNWGAVIRVWLLALIALAVWGVSHVAEAPNAAVLDTSAAPTVFSAGRAENVLARVLGPEKPHPVSTAENAAVRARILKEFAALGIPAHTYQAFTCNAWRGFSFIACATVTDVIADVVPGDGKAIILLAHYDSVPAGPGASDDESGVATVLETARALKARGSKSLHPIMAVITDGEEAGLLGANAFLQNDALKARVGAVVNVEARGNHGPSLLFQTSPGDGKLIDLYAASGVKQYATSSLYAEIYKFLPNDTDLTLFIKAGFPSFNFAFADNVQHYHSPLDLRRNLSPATLQMHGDNMLGVVSSLEQTDYAALKGGNDIYLSVLGVAIPRLPESLALPFALLIFVAIAAASWLARREPFAWRPTLLAAVMPLALIAGFVAIGFVLAFIAQKISGQPDPTYAFPINMRLALGFGLFAMTLLVSRMTTARGAASSAWLWIAGLGVITAALLPGISPYFTFPAFIAAILLLATARTQAGWTGTVGQVALFVSA